MNDAQSSNAEATTDVSKPIIPWEDPTRKRVFRRFVTTLWAFVKSPTAAYSRMPTSGGLGRPLAFAIVVGWIGIAVAAFIGKTFPDVEWASEDLHEYYTFSGVASQQEYFGVPLMIAAPVIVLVVIFLQAKIIQFLLGKFGTPNLGFQTTIRVCCYAQTSQLVHTIPLIGGVLFVGWSMLLIFHGISVAHGITRGRSAAIVIAGFLLTCALVATGFIILVETMMDFTFPR